MTEEELLVSKRRYVMEEQKRIEARRNTRIDLIYALSQPGTTELAVFTKNSIEVQKQIVKANEATLNPQMGTGKRKDTQAKAFYQPRGPSQPAFQETLPPKLINPEMPQPTGIPMSNTASIGAGWKTSHLVEMYLHEALGGLKVGEMPTNWSSAATLGPANTFRFPGGTTVHV
jgi:hypothetical protein